MRRHLRDSKGHIFRVLQLVAALLIGCVSGLGCSLGPRSIERSRLQYNEAIKTTTEQQLLLNIVRLRYLDSPSSLSITAIAQQQEIAAGLRAVPFFTSAAAGDIGSYRGAILPGVELSGASRPTLSYTPIDDQEFTRRLFTPITLDGLAYLGKTTWPIATVFRLYLENANWVSNAETASGPTPRQQPVYAEFLAGVEALQRLRDRSLAVLHSEEREERLTDGVPAGPGTAGAAVEAAKAGLEYRKDDKNGWVTLRKRQQPLLRLGTLPDDDPDLQAFCRAFKLDPAKRKFELTTEKLDPFLAGTPKAGLDALDLETRSLLQVLFFVAHGVQVPPPHLLSGVAPQTVESEGKPFDWDQVLTGLFKVCWADGKNPPPHAHVSVRYNGYWFYIDQRDRDTKATFNLLMELSRLELGAKLGTAPVLTLPIGGR
ncbi:hypothetical protein BH10PLA2_BH10PLA2_33200 [soil metagenome]